MTGEPTAGQVWLAYNSAENTRDRGALMALVAADLQVTINGCAAVSSVADDTAAMESQLAAYPDYRREVVSMLDTGPQASVRWRMLGTPRGGTSRPHLDVSGCSVVSVRDGCLAVAHLYYDGPALNAVLAKAREDRAS
jgi:hypothetical protein